MEKDRAELSSLLKTMDVPPARIQANPEDIHWLGRNVALNNAGDPNLPRVRQLLVGLGARLVM